jgi:hypothetical protein
VQPERELVERQAGADAEHHGEDRQPRVLGIKGETKEADEQHDHDPEDEMVNVEAARRLHASRPPGHLGAAGESRARTDEQERSEQPDQEQSGRLAPGLDRLVHVELNDV